jgi:hypothetical protein
MTPQERGDCMRRYAEGPALLRAALAKVPAEAMKWRPAAGEWSVHEVILHCADSETNAHMRLRYLLAEKDPVIVGYDQDHWARELDYHALPVEPALAAVEGVRANTVPLLRRLPEPAWQRQGRHTESGAYGVLDWLRVYAEHLEIHTRQIEQNLAAWQARTTGGASRS